MDAIIRDSSFAQYLEERGLKRGLEQGIKQGIEQGLEQGIERGIEQGLERGIEQGIEQGLEQGIEQGLEQGIERGIRESIREALEIRFDAGVAGQFAARIATIDDLQRLKRLHRAAMQADDLASFQRMLDAEA